MRSRPQTKQAQAALKQLAPLSFSFLSFPFNCFSFLFFSFFSFRFSSLLVVYFLLLFPFSCALCSFLVFSFVFFLLSVVLGFVYSLVCRFTFAFFRFLSSFLFPSQFFFHVFLSFLFIQGLRPLPPAPCQQATADWLPAGM